ncbi:Octicosapeptide/Phox/Bem1p domain-containing protein [Quillaja saponaria]|uniref:Octicosapeptide/Phox/Bem1p domain-containing protein n=1 Tax=Quillaja saponaria TaxID=32244 RepID=A0AAD7M122_QUISA|nr:Octicosapeptide/Phox/Bem1p domain-containing protein [Quillaja saponaria]
MAGEGVEETVMLSPSNRVKFLCSHGGKILPRPSDAYLKYVGGEIRVIAVHRDITFSELMKKLTAHIDGDMVLKYQFIPEDLDALVSVRSDEDLKHMFAEYDRHQSEGAPMLRAFLFPSKPIILENQPVPFEPHALEQRYIDAINGVIQTSSNPGFSPSKGLSISSACSSPKSNSPEDHIDAVTITYDTASFNGFHSSRLSSMHKVLSSPSICLNNLQNNSNGCGNHNIQQYPHYYNHNQQQQQHCHRGYNSNRLLQNPQKISGIERLVPTLSLGREDIGRGLMVNEYNHYHLTNKQHMRGIGGNNCGYYYDECGAYGGGRIDRTESLPRSPRKTNWALGLVNP